MRIVVLLSLIALVHCAAHDFPPVTDFGPTNTFGRELQRTMRLIHQSPPEKKRTVKVQFYGQSITQAYWSHEMAEFLKRSYPNARILTTNLALSFTSELLIKPAMFDLVPQYPDLLIFHVYGSLAPYEEIIAQVRRRTTADILIQGDHPTTVADLIESTAPGEITLSSSPAWRNYISLPRLATNYSSEFADLRTYWKTYLRQHDYLPENLLRDHVHPNVQGEFVLRQLLQSHLRFDPSFSDATWRDAVKDIDIDHTLATSRHTLTVPFVGNRVDLVLSRDGTAPVQVRIDGKRPTEFPELYAFNRPSFYPGIGWPTILHIDSKTPLVDETWTATVIESRTNGWPHIRFSLRGSWTGFDGEGTSTNLFVSNSGRVVIAPDDWRVLAFATWWFPKVQPLPVGHEIKWNCTAYALDEFLPKISDPAIENTVTVAQGLANGAHTLTLSGPDLAALESIRIYNPLARAQPQSSAPLRIEDLRVVKQSLSLRISAPRRYVVEAASGPSASWHPVTAPITDRSLSLPLTPRIQFLRLRNID